MNKCWCGNEELVEYSKDYLKCMNCKTLVSKYDFKSSIYDVKSEDIDLYGSNYWEEVMLKEANVENLDQLIDLYIPERAAYWVKHILRHTHVGESTAEVGCGMGQLSYLLKSIGYSVTDFELSPSICDVLRKKLGLTVICGELQDSNAKYNNIIAIDVFEHLMDPEKFLDECFLHLENDGVLVMQTPCYDPTLSFDEMRAEKPRFEHLLVPDQHIYLFSRETIKQLLFKHGFNNVFFVPAFFGDDYDMFLFAFKGKLIENDNRLVESFLNSHSDGRLIKAIISMNETIRNFCESEKKIKENRDILLDDAQKLTAMCEQKDKEIKEYLNAAEDRLKVIEDLNAMCEQKDKEIKEYLNAAEDRVKVIEDLNAMCSKKEEIIEKLDSLCSKKDKEMDEYKAALELKVGINLTTLFPGKIGGAEQYVRNTIHSMSRMDGVKQYVFVNDKAYSTFKSSENITIIEVKSGADVDTELLYGIDYYNIDIMFCPLFFVAPKDCPIPTVASILDVQHEFYPEYFEKKVLKDIRRLTDQTLKSVSGIITISEYSKQTIVDKYGISASKIKVTHLNSDATFDSALDERELKRIKHDIAEKYIFYPANSWPHKNHINLLKAYKILKNSYNFEYKLVFTGDSKQKEGEITRFISQNNLEDDVIYLGYRKQEEMPYIFAGATVLVFPSLFEGFGIPLVEAMRVDTAIACSSCGSIPEVAQNAALYFDPNNPEDIAEKIYELVSNKEKRDELIKNGKEVVKRYSWDRCAELTVDYLREIAHIPSLKCKQELPLVTVVTPSYNQGEFIRETIESVLSQDYPNIEYIVMDGGSSDNTVDILKQYGDRIKWYSEKDQGQGDAVNKGIKLAQGSIIGWLNSDDTYLEGAISKIVDYFMSHPNTGMVYGEAYYTDKSGEITERYPTMHYNKGVLASNCFICQPAAFFKRDAALQAGLIDISYQCSMDYEFWMRMANSTKISYIPDYIATSRLYEENKTLSRREEVFTECCKATKTNFGYVPISWCDGYADYKADGQRNTKFYLYRNYYLLKYNFDNIKYLRNTIKDVSRLKLKARIKHILRLDLDTEFSGQFEDGWLSKQYITTIPNDSGKKLVVSGTKAWPLKEHLVIKIFINGTNIGKIDVVENSDFSRTIQIPTELRHQKQIEVKLKMNKTFNPSRIAGSSDIRELSFILKELTIGDE